jgi:hypothetical protein
MSLKFYAYVAILCVQCVGTYLAARAQFPISLVAMVCLWAAASACMNLVDRALD